MFSLDEIDKTWIYEWSNAGDDWVALNRFRVVQQVDLTPKLLAITEHRARLYRHRITGRVVSADLPKEVSRGGLIGPRLTALIGYQKGVCHMSYALIQRFLEGCTGILGEAFGGVIGCDYHSAYRKFLHETDARMQFCWAHLIRDVKFLTTLPDKCTRRYGERLLSTIKTLFRVWHRRGETPTTSWQRAAERARRKVLEVARHPPRRTEASNIAARFREHGMYYFLFLTVPGVEPTNNAMERGFRHLVADRKLTQGTRGLAGRRWCERIWTALATCAQQKRSAFDFICRSVMAHLSAKSPPTLLPFTS